MSTIVRSELESYISTEQMVISKRLRGIIAEAIKNREYDLSTSLEALVSSIRMFTPLKSSYTRPMDYINALRSYALALSIISEMLGEVHIGKDVIDLCKRILDLAKEGLPVGKIADGARELLSGMGEAGNKIFINGCRKYVNILIGKVKELDPQELQIIKETVKEIIGHVERPYARISDISRILGTKEKDLLSILKRIAGKDPNIIVTKSIITIKDKMKDYLEKRIRESHYMLIGDLAREWSVDIGDVLEVLGEVSDIYPGLEVFEGIVISTMKSLSDYFVRLVDDEMVTSTRFIATKMGVRIDALRKILVRLHKYSPDIIMGDSEIVAHRQKICDWLRSIIGDRAKVYVEEFSGRLGVSTKVMKRFIEDIARMYGEFVLAKNELIYVPNLSRNILSEITSRKESSEVRDIIKKHPDAVEAEIFNNINKILKEFEEKISRGSVK